MMNIGVGQTQLGAASSTGVVGTEGALSFMINDDLTDEEDIDIENCPLHYTLRPRKRTTYCRKTVVNIQITYIIAAVIWIVLIFVFGLYKADIVGWIILAIPLVVFAVNYVNLTCITQEIEGEMLKGNFLSFAFLITVILINWSKIEDKSKYFRILLLALIFLMLSLVDIWVKPENMPLMRHIRTIFHTASLTLLVFALYLYYADVIYVDPNKKPDQLSDSTDSQCSLSVGCRNLPWDIRG